MPPQSVIADGQTKAFALSAAIADETCTSRCFILAPEPSGCAHPDRLSCRVRLSAAGKCHVDTCHVNASVAIRQAHRAEKQGRLPQAT